VQVVLFGTLTQPLLVSPGHSAFPSCQESQVVDELVVAGGIETNPATKLRASCSRLDSLTMRFVKYIAIHCVAESVPGVIDMLRPPNFTPLRAVPIALS